MGYRIRISRNLLLLLLCTLLLIPGELLAQDGRNFSDLPEILRLEADGRNIRFVSVERAFSDAGELDGELFSEATQDLYNYALTKPEEDGCIQFDIVSSNDEHRTVQKNYSEGVRFAQTIVIARVLRISPGFEGGTLGSMLELETEEALKGTSRNELFFVFFAAAKFTLGDKKICKNNNYYGPLPEIGDRLIVLIHPQKKYFSFPYVLAGPADLIVFKKDKTLQLPWLYRQVNSNKSLSTPEQFLEWTRDLVEEEDLESFHLSNRHPALKRTPSPPRIPGTRRTR